jgi:hypothetical protein
VVVKVSSPHARRPAGGDETAERHAPEQIICKLRDADAMLNSGKDRAAVLQPLEISEATYLCWRNQYGGMKAEELRHCVLLLPLGS